MVPVKASTLIKPTADKLGFPEDVAKKVLESYYKLAKEKLTSLEFSSFVFEGLGKFYIKTKATDKKANTLTYIVDNIGGWNILGPKKESTLRTAKEDLDKVRKMQEMIEEIRQKAAFVKLHKKTYKDEKIKKALEGQVDNSESNSPVSDETSED